MCKVYHYKHPCTNQLRVLLECGQSPTCAPPGRLLPTSPPITADPSYEFLPVFFCKFLKLYMKMARQCLLLPAFWAKHVSVTHPYGLTHSSNSSIFHSRVFNYYSMLHMLYTTYPNHLSGASITITYPGSFGWPSKLLPTCHVQHALWHPGVSSHPQLEVQLLGWMGKCSSDLTGFPRCSTN